MERRVRLAGEGLGACPALSSAVAGLDQALWDIAGRALGVPVHQLLGGAVHDEVRVNGWIGGAEPADVAEAAAAQVEAGLTAVKMNAVGRVRPEPCRGRRPRRTARRGA